MRFVTTLVALSAGLAALAGCGDDAGGFAGRRAVGTFVTSWSEAGYDRDAVDRLAGDRLVRDAGELDALVALAGPELDTTEVEAVDLDEHVLVVGSYPACDEYSRVVVTADGSELVFEVIKPNPDNPVMCAWSPMQVDVWQVPRADLADDVRLGVAGGG